MKDKILIIGGHGHVGSVITRTLEEKYPQKLIIAGRKLASLQRFKEKQQLSVELVVFDIQQPPQPELFRDISLVIVCIDQQTTDFAIFCQKMGIDYLDVSANTAFYHRLKETPFDETTGLVYSVGIAPGVTNLMAAKVAQQLPDFQEMAIKVILGLGDQHGDGAIDWTLSHLSETYQLANRQKPIKAFSEKAYLQLGNQDLPTYSFNFSDQHSLRNRWPSKSITTYLGFDVKPITNLLHRLQQLKLLRLLERPNFKEIAKKNMMKGGLGTDLFYVQVTASNNRGQVKSVTIMGRNEASVTGKVAAYVATRVYQSDIRGFVQIEDIFTLEELIVGVPELKVIKQAVN